MVTGRPIELLAPARDPECGRAAVDCGADAVYIGGPAFGARAAVSNSIDGITSLITYAHRFRVNVYVTVNTILTDDEVPAAAGLIRLLYEQGADGVIIQDMGLLEYGLPPVPILASTQTHNIDPQKIRFFEKLGLKRVILARELSLDEIRAVRAAAPDIGLEFFVHGALCTGYSGRCYLSHALGGRSGNRGVCAQPCRRFYRLEDRDGRQLAAGHLLSLKDLNLSRRLQDLIEAGIDSFKIEGRLKDITYTKNIVSYYRREIDRILPAVRRGRTSSGSSSIPFEPDPAKTFNRGYTEYMLDGRQPGTGSPATPKMVGEYVGSVITPGRTEILLDADNALSPGDGICFFNPGGRLEGATVNRVDGRTVSIRSTGTIAAGTRIYRNHDHAFITMLKKAKAVRSIGIRAGLTVTPAQLILTMDDGEGTRIETAEANTFPAARQPDAARETIIRQLSKTGGSGFRCGQVTVEAAEMPFIPAGVLNALRRRGLELLAQAKLNARPQPRMALRTPGMPWPAKKLTYEANVLNKYAEAFYRRHGVTEVERAAEAGTDISCRRVMTAKHCLRYALGLCPDAVQAAAPPARHPEPWTLIDENNRRLHLRFDCGHCRMEIFLDS